MTIRSPLTLQSEAGPRGRAPMVLGARRWGDGGQVELWFSAVSGCRDIKLGECFDARRLLLIYTVARVCPSMYKRLRAKANPVQKCF